MKKYYVRYWKDFANTYSLFYTENSEQEKLLPENAERITRKEAEQLCRDENYRRKSDQAFSHFADNLIFPIDFNADVEYAYDENRFYIDGFIVNRVKRNGKTT
jgi:hypothetical protein